MLLSCVGSALVVLVQFDQVMNLMCRLAFRRPVTDCLKQLYPNLKAQLLSPDVLAVSISNVLTGRINQENNSSQPLWITGLSQLLPASADYLPDHGIQQVDKELTVFQVAGAAGLEDESLRGK